MVVVESLYCHIVSISVRGLYFVQVKSGRKEQYRFAICGHQSFINIGCNTTGPSKQSQSRCFQQSKIPVTSTYSQNRLDCHRITCISYCCSIMNCFNFHAFPGIYKFTVSVKVSAAMPENSQRFIYSCNHNFSFAASEPLHFNFNVSGFCFG